ncbi:protein-disulfide reductase DsbD domain-containing protein [Pseudogemmobacter bohemicus]|uniref:protein-disulfide reductase DsbD domain-containing protein n=1 Tax=Pseudogemmobacter bohemicus TaxID=2250708 RepID=UPI000DD395D2|nr:protein-disulfide reductase DsbD domain-containing protein [Pseudogemmobacter bohemicus]
MTRILALALAAACLAAQPFAAQAWDMSQDKVLQASVLNGWTTAEGTRMAALRLDLAPGWKTYWRSPGEAGIPPSFDWSGSVNLKSVRIHWPAPTIFHTNGMQTIGYKEQLILPVELTPEDPSRPIRLVVNMDMGICRDICLPAEVDLDADLTMPGARDPLIDAALAKRPKTGKEAGLSAITCAVEPISDGLRLTAKVTVPALGRNEAVAIETADKSVWVSAATATREGKVLTAVADLVPPSGQPFALDRSGVIVTVVSDKDAAELRGCPGG